MTLKRVNGVVSCSFEEPNPIPGQPPVPKTVMRGEVYDFPDYYVQQKESEKVLVHYPAPAGESLRVARYEPVLVDPDGGDEYGDRAKADADIAKLLEQVEQIKATRPPGPRPFDVPAANEVVLGPSTTGTRLVGEVAQPLTQGVRLQAPAPAPEPAPEPVTVGKGDKSK